MCFVSFVPCAEGYMLGSNRDEHQDRPQASPPTIQPTPYGNALLPIDGKAGGTWVALRQDGLVAVLLNGAFEPHARGGIYAHSRGKIIKDALQQPSPAAWVPLQSWGGYEPFTLVLYLKQLIVFRWDRVVLHRQVLNPLRPHCWSSATLYDYHQQQQRGQWFFDAWHAQIWPTPAHFFHWHSMGGRALPDCDLVMQRSNGIRTISTTVAYIAHGECGMYYKHHGVSGDGSGYTWHNSLILLP